MLERVFKKVAGLQRSCEYCEIFNKSFFHEIPPAAASQKSTNLLDKCQWRRRNRFIFLLNTTE